MKRLSVQAPKGVVMIRPHHFGPNPMTAKDNAFQATDAARQPSAIALAAHEEVTRMADGLRAAGPDWNTWSPDSLSVGQAGTGRRERTPLLDAVNGQSSSAR